VGMRALGMGDVRGEAGGCGGGEGGGGLSQGCPFLCSGAA